MPISRGQMPRQLYGLGSFVKSIGKGIKKAVKGVTKVAKSPLGMAAISLAFPQVRAGLGSFFGKGSFNPLRMAAEAAIGESPMTQLSPFGSMLSKLGLATAEGGGTLTTLGKAAGIVAPSIIGGMLTPKAQEDVDALRRSGDRGLLQAYLRQYYGNLNPNASSEDIEEFVRTNSAEGGRIGYAKGDTAEQNAMQASGIMGLPLNENPAGVTELDLRESGGFIPPVGVKEKADDIPAMLSNNEFVFTADAVRGMGDGNVNLGAQRMYDMMKKLENGGRV